MEETYTTKAIILNRRPFREFDSKTTVYSFDKGKLELVARGAKKIKSKLAGHLEPINLSDLMVIRGKQFDYIGGAVSKNCYSNIKNDLEKLTLAGRIIYAFNKLVKEADKADAPDIFGLLQEFLRILNKNELSRTFGISYKLLADFFILKLLVQLGYKPELYNCVVCGNKILPKNNNFDFFKGGIICADCQTSLSVSPITKEEGRRMSFSISTDCIKVLRLVIESDFGRLTKLKINDILAKEINKIICSFLKFHS